MAFIEANHAVVMCRSSRPARQLWRNFVSGIAAAVALILASSTTAAAPARAATLAAGFGSAKDAGSWAQNTEGSVHLVAAVGSLGQDRDIRMGLVFRMEPGWKIYWRSPGDAGFPPLPDWAKSKNVRPGALKWPTPNRFSVLGLQTLGYEGTVVLPFSARVDDLSRPGAGRRNGALSDLL